MVPHADESALQILPHPLLRAIAFTESHIVKDFTNQQCKFYLVPLTAFPSSFSLFSDLFDNQNN